MAVLEPVPGTNVYLWKYVPNLTASIVFAALYFIVGCLLSFRMYKTKTWFCSAFVAGCFMEVIGYIARAFCVNNTDQLAPYIIESTFIVIPPAFFAATIYMCLARIIRFVDGDHLSIIRPQIVTRFFVTGDILSFSFQGNATGLLVHPNLRLIATVLIVIGLFIQLISFILFAVCAIIFHMRFRRKPTPRSEYVDRKWVQTLYMLYAVSVLIVIRSIFRIVEYISNADGFPMEWTLFAFDSIPMSLVTILFFLWYPSNLVPKMGNDDAIRLRSQGSCDVAGQS